MAVPTVRLEDAQLGEPVGDEVEVAAEAGAGEGARDLGVPVHLDLYGLAGWTVTGPRVRTATVRSCRFRSSGETKRKVGMRSVASQPSPARSPGRVDLERAPVTRSRLAVRAAAANPVLGHPGAAIVAPRVPVEMEPQLSRRLLLDVGPGQDLASGKRLGRRSRNRPRWCSWRFAVTAVPELPGASPERLRAT